MSEITTLVKSYPQFNVELVTEDSAHVLTYDTAEDLTAEDLDENIISFSIKNSMGDDTPVFSLIVLAKNKWDMVLSSNDLIRISVTPDATKEKPDNPYIMVGLISDIHKEGDYGKGRLLYRITGRAMSKALIDFEVGVIQEVSVIQPDIGWLPNDEEDGILFSGRSASQIGHDLMEEFVYKYAEYSFDNDKTLEDYFTHAFSSWEDESLSDVTPFINYEGSMRQFLEDVSAKPFNELFFEYNKEGQCVAVMRPTPFDPDKWKELPTYNITSDTVVEESFGKTDSEMYSVYVVSAPNLVELSSMELGVFPKYHPALVNKYGYKRLDAENRYLLTSQLGMGDEEEGTDEEEDEEEDSGKIAPSYKSVLEYVKDEDSNFNDKEYLRKNKDDAIEELRENFPNMNKELAHQVVVATYRDTLNKKDYDDATETTGSQEDREVNREKNASGEKLERYTERLYNWYCENANFYSGDIRVKGDPSYRVGSVIMYQDFEQKTTWEFYVESVQHEFSFTNGYTTILGVTRGLPNRGVDRFSHFWGQSEDFKGGDLGEPSLEELMSQGVEDPSSYEGASGQEAGYGDRPPTSEVVNRVVQKARDSRNLKSRYSLGAGRQQENPLYTAGEAVVDCSSFVWWVFKDAGVSLKGGKTGMTTDTIKNDGGMKTVSSRGSSKASAKSKLRLGDLVYFDTYKIDGHLGIYVGNGQFVGAQDSTGIARVDMDNSYWDKHFKGHVERYVG